MKRLAERVYKSYPGLVQAMLKRHEVYNETLDYIEGLESQGKAIVIRPTEAVTVGRMEKNPAKLQALYELGYRDAERAAASIKAWRTPAPPVGTT